MKQERVKDRKTLTLFEGKRFCNKNLSPALIGLKTEVILTL